MTVAEILTAECDHESRKWSQADLARRLAAELGDEVMHRSRVHNWFKGHAVPDAALLPAICRVFGMSATKARALYAACGVDLGPVLGDDNGAAA